MNWHDAADAKLDLWSFWQTDAGERVARYFYESVKLKDEGGAHTHLSYEKIQELELVSMYRAEPIWVAPEIMDIAEAASETFRPESFEHTDLITPHGFVLLPRPHFFPDARGKMVSFRAFAWQPIVETGEDGKPGRQGVWVSSYSHIDDLPQEDDGASSYRSAKVAQRDLGYSTPWIFLHGTMWYFGMTPTEMVDRSIIPSYQTQEAAEASTNAWWRFTQSLLRLSMQHMSTRQRLAYPRQAKRRALRAKMGPDRITVITLRKPRSKSAENEHEPVQWKNRWVVGGHWRNQWYSSLNKHRQIWISDYIKGPEDKPLALRKGRAFNFTR